VLEALKILESATLSCKKRSIDTPEVNQALDVLEPYCRPEWKVVGFRHSLDPCGESRADREGQQQVLRVYFAGIHGNVRKLLSARIGTLDYRYRKTHDHAVKAELDRLIAELERLSGALGVPLTNLTTPGHFRAGPSGQRSPRVAR
jgi:hypothetical protein